MDEKQCEIYRDGINEKLKIHDKRLDAHSERLDAIEKRNAKMDERVEHLMSEIKELVDATKWLRKCVYGGLISAAFGIVVYLVKIALTK